MFKGRRRRKSQLQEEGNPFLCLFVLFWLPANWMVLTHIEGGSSPLRTRTHTPVSGNALTNIQK
jgi:hypothetical protein